ncbi:DUF7336 domain-containing protein [Chitiniphilus eburneus]|uniref:DUF7336 domain-containing protein n=1 Tax=Chitiniphilus eburneus TaxID=2571148 RepID=A0A4U0PGA7_9NEIS|nr:hypothetical protein [Chitiniphilus eburneus]TJZ66847.1 hypothetical protein FAZ21_16825 [Chitiniphilus eburneus]
MDSVYILHHVHELPGGEEDVKFIGVYASDAEARLAISRLSEKPGFMDAPDGFDIQKYQVGKDHWVEGYFTYIPE